MRRWRRRRRWVGVWQGDDDVSGILLVGFIRRGELEEDEQGSVVCEFCVEDFRGGREGAEVQGGDGVAVDVAAEACDAGGVGEAVDVEVWGRC